MVIKSLDICITTYNRNDKLIDTLEVLSKQTNMDFNLIINDDGSNLPFDYISYPLITKFIWNKDNGYNRVARFNESVSLCRSPNVVIMDDDCIPANNSFVQSYIDFLEKYEVVAGQVRFPCGGGTVDGDSKWFSTCNLGFRLELFKRMGLFDECYNGHYGFEDHDLGNTYSKEGVIVGQGDENTLVNHGHDMYKNGDRSPEILGHNRAEFLRKWDYDPTEG